VSGIIAAAINDVGTQGVAPRAEIVPFKVLRSTTGSGSFLWVAQGIVDAANIDADVINMSLGATFARPLAGGYGPYVALLTRAINFATQQGTLVVIAAGNEGLDLDSIYWSVPAQLGLGMGVSATGPEGLFSDPQTDLDRFASYSNYGSSVVDVAAPGGDFSLYPNPVYVYDMVLSPGGRNAAGAYLYYFAAGTSMAAPHVSGLAALIVGEHGKMSPTDLKTIIEQTAVDLYKPGADAWSGRGRIDAVRVFGIE
jgi:subtilisin family serine protease